MAITDQFADEIFHKRTQRRADQHIRKCHDQLSIGGAIDTLVLIGCPPELFRVCVRPCG